MGNAAIINNCIYTAEEDAQIKYLNCVNIYTKHFEQKMKLLPETNIKIYSTLFTNKFMFKVYFETIILQVAKTMFKLRFNIIKFFECKCIRCTRNFYSVIDYENHIESCLSTPLSLEMYKYIYDCKERTISWLEYLENHFQDEYKLDVDICKAWIYHFARNKTIKHFEQMQRERNFDDSFNDTKYECKTMSKDLMDETKKYINFENDLY